VLISLRLQRKSHGTFGWRICLPKPAAGMRISANRPRDTRPTAVRPAISRRWRTSYAPILTSWSRSIVIDHRFTASGDASIRRKLPFCPQCGFAIHYGRLLTRAAGSRANGAIRSTVLVDGRTRLGDQHAGVREISVQKPLFRPKHDVTTARADRVAIMAAVTADERPAL
jgi:hypothetical protein